MEGFVWAAQKQECIHTIWDTWKQIWARYMFKIVEYRPDQEGNLISIWAGNLSFAGKSFGMSVHLLPGTCTGFQQLLTGNAGRGAAPSQPGPAAPAAQHTTANAANPKEGRTSSSFCPFYRCWKGGWGDLPPRGSVRAGISGYGSQLSALCTDRVSWNRFGGRFLFLSHKREKNHLPASTKGIISSCQCCVDLSQGHC